jgi:signal transduction histidine kinase
MNTTSALAPSNFMPGHLWHRLTRPHPSLHDLETIRQSRLLAALTLALLVTSTIASVILTARWEDGIHPISQLLLPGQIATFILYMLNRAGRYHLSAAIFVGMNFLMVHFMPLASDIAWLFFTPMVIIFSAILMTARITNWLFIVSIVIQLGYIVIDPQEAQMSNYSSFIIFLNTAIMILVFMNHRTALERERQQELREANKRLRESEIQLEQRVAKRTAELATAKHETEIALQRALEADQLKSQFLASMSHELRTPLNAILTFSDLLAIGTFGEVSDEQNDYLQKILFSGRHLLALINDVLDITKIQSGMLKLFLENNFDVHKELDNIIIAASKILGDKPVQLTADIATDISQLTCDKRRVRQILLNLISNAVKFTEQGSITVTARQENDHVLFTIADTGPGIKPDQQKIIFEPFVQTETGIRHAGGTGLGLPISKQLAEAHGGRLWLESTPGQGSSFYVSLPLQPTPKPIES